MMQTIHNTSVYDTGVLAELEKLFMRAGLDDVEFDEDNQRLSFRADTGVIVELELDSHLKKEIQEAKRWAEDANRVADYYWRQ